MPASPNMFDRELLIQGLIQWIENECDVPIGDHVAPESGGWSQGQPGAGVFMAYSVVASGPVRVTASSLCSGCYDYSATMTIRSFGATRTQADDTALKIRTALHAHKIQFGLNKTRLIWCTQIGPVDRMDDTNPKYWRVADTYTIDCVPL